MASLARLALLLTTALTVLAASSPQSSPLPSSTLKTPNGTINPLGIVTRPFPMADAVPLTNAQRLARGLSPKRPRFRSHAAAVQPRQSGGCAMRTGTIAAAVNGYGAGYVRHDVNSYGEFGYTDDPAQALIVTFCPSADTYVSLQTLNGLSTFNYLGGVESVDSNSPNLGTGASTFNFVYLAGTIDAPRSTPIPGPNAFSAAAGIPEPYEATIWQLGAGDALLPSWLNTDGSAPAVTIVYSTGDDAFVLTGDSGSVIALIGAASTATFTFVSA
ncbi:hypothetical protein C8Q80DRAFT_1222955 [Daedaleopsis nitida]|nr:hypothetical protein C8Q80DRAFT_1222955 [Daedaleopsis nitida]